MKIHQRGWNGAMLCCSVKKDVEVRDLQMEHSSETTYYYYNITHILVFWCEPSRRSEPPILRPTDEGKLISFPLSAEQGPEVSPHGGSWECHSHFHARDPSSSSVSLLPWYSPTLSPNVTESKTNSTGRIYQGGTSGLMAACKSAKPAL